MSLFYVAFFLVPGVHLPFWPLWLADHGLGASEIALLVAAASLTKVVSNPLLLGLADRAGERKRAMVLFAVLAGVFFGLFALARDFWALLAVSVLFAGAFSAVLPLGESIAVGQALVGGAQYGRVRLWGSLSFVGGSMLAGWLLGAVPVAAVFWMVSAALAALAAVAWVVPGGPPPPALGPRRPLRAVLAVPGVLGLVVASMLIQGSHAVYYVFGTLHWRAQGFSTGLIGLLWAEGVVAEIVLFSMGGWLLARIGAARLVMLGGLAAAVRWPATGLADGPGALFGLQLLHAFTFGATHLGALHLIGRLVPAAAAATAQGLLAAAGAGIGLGLGALAAGPLYQSYGAGAFYGMAAMGALGALLAMHLARGPLREP